MELPKKKIAVNHGYVYNRSIYLDMFYQGPLLQN